MSEKTLKLVDEVTKLFENQEFFLYDIEIAQEGGKQYLRVFIDSEKGVDIEACLNANTIVSEYFDENDPLEDEYILEVASPGVFRKLRTVDHFNSQLNKTILVKLKSNIDGIDGKKIEAVLTEVTETYIVVGDIKIPVDKIKKAESTYQF